MNHIFISYSRQDTAYARALADRLLAEGFDVWIDDRIDYGDDWWQTIVTAIRGCAAFVVIMSPNSDDSRWVQREVNIADELSKPAFPLLLAGDVVNSKNWLIYGRTQYLDVRDGSLPPPAYYDTLARRVPRAAQPGHVVTKEEVLGDVVDAEVIVIEQAGTALVPARQIVPAPPRHIARTGFVAAGVGALAIIGVAFMLLNNNPIEPEADLMPSITVVIVADTPSPSPAPSTPTNTPAATSTPTPTAQQANAQTGLYAPPLENYRVTRAFSRTQPVSFGWSLAADPGEPVRIGSRGGGINWTLICSRCTPEQPSTVSQGLTLGDARVFSDPAWGYGYGTLIVVSYENARLPETTKMQISAAFDVDPSAVHVYCLYAHLLDILVNEGDVLAPDQVMARSGNTGASTGPHLYLECRWSEFADGVGWNELDANIFDPALLFDL